MATEPEGSRPGRKDLSGPLRTALILTKKAIVAFTEAEGADSHCEPTASGIRGERIFDWLGEQIPA